MLFNRFYQPDFDLDNLEVVPSLTLSSSYELLLRLHWTAILYGRVQADLAVTGGVHTAEDVLKAMMAGARVAMMTSALLLHGIEHLHAVRDGIARLDGGARVRVDPADAGQHELPLGPRPLRLRARELHEGAELVRLADARWRQAPAFEMKGEDVLSGEARGPAGPDRITRREDEHELRA